MLRNFALFVLLCFLLGIDAEFASYAIGGGLLNGSIVSIVFFTGLIAFGNVIVLQLMYKVYTDKEFFK